MDFSSISSGIKGASAAEKKEAIKQSVSQELALSNAQTLVTKATEKCYAKCVPSPSAQLTSKEQTCTERCLERYFEAFNIISTTYVRRIASEREAAAISPSL